MERSLPEDEISAPPMPLLSTLQETTTGGVNANSEKLDFELHPNADSNATSTTAATRLHSLLNKFRMLSPNLFTVVGVLASLSVFPGQTYFRLSPAEGHGHHSSRDINPESVTVNSSRSLRAHDGDGAGASVGAPLSPEQSIALLVAVDNDTLTIWSDFVSSARKRPGSDVSQKQEPACGNDGSKPDCGIHDEEDKGETGEERERSAAPVEKQHDCDHSCFPPVWIVTSDPRVDRVVKEDMPHLLSLFVPFDSYGRSDGTGGPNSNEDHTRWADALHRFLSDNPGVDVFGFFGEGTLPTAALLPGYIDSYFAASDIGGGGGGGGVVGDRSGISSVLWPVLSAALPPTAVISRSRMWWDGVDGGTSSGLGDWMSDKFVAQVWCNRAMLVATRRGAMNSAEHGLAVNHECNTFLDVIQGLVREPSAAGVVLVDGTKVIPSRFLHPPINAEVGVFDEDNRDNGGDGQTNEYVSLRRLVQHAREKTERERQRRQEQQLEGVQTSGFTTAPGPTPRQLKPLPEINYYIGALELTLGFDLEAMPPGPEFTTTTVREVPDQDDSPTVSGTTKSEYQSGGEDEGDGTENGVVGYAAVATIIRANWPPEYILDTVVQPLFTSEEREERPTSPVPAAFDNGGWGVSQAERKQQGIVIVSSVNCGYVDMASNFLQSVKRFAGDVKVLFVARDEVTFDFLDALSPGCVVLFRDVRSERAHSVQAGKFGDDIFKQQTVVRPDVLLAILRQGYKALYTDVDIVWLGNVFSLLPNSRETQKPPVEVIYHQGQSRKCTCFLYLDSTTNVIRLLELWKQKIVEKDYSQDQAGFQRPLSQMKRAGLSVRPLPEEAMLQGRDAFSEEFVKNNYAILQDSLLIIHNNHVIGHKSKEKRFRDAGLWEVGDWEFPTCQRRNLISQGE